MDGITFWWRCQRMLKEIKRNYRKKFSVYARIWTHKYWKEDDCSRESHSFIGDEEFPARRISEQFNTQKEAEDFIFNSEIKSGK